LALALHRFCLTLETGDRLLGRIHERVECGPGLLDAFFRHGAQFGGHFEMGNSILIAHGVRLESAHPTRHSMLR
jgi:hypothetical protein